MKKLRTAVLISGSGRTLQNFIDLSRQGELPIEIVLVISSRRGVAGIDRAQAADIPVEVIPRRDMSDAEFNARVTAMVDAVRVDLVCLAGFLSRWEIPARYKDRVLNIHPALLPKYGGIGYHGHHVHEAVIAAGDKTSGCTVHFANNAYDEGPIILQRSVPVLPNDTPDTLAERVFEQECIAYPEAIRLFAAGKLKIVGDKVEILPESTS
jgi:phosphoribosylglycinamide formyltransferase 1